MKNNAFKQTFYSGVILFVFLFLIIVMILSNIFNFIKPKITEYLNKECVVVETTQVDSSFNYNSVPFEVINKPTKELVDTLRITPKPEVKSIQPTIIVVEKKDSVIIKDTTN